MSEAEATTQCTETQESNKKETLVGVPVKKTFSSKNGKFHILLIDVGRNQKWVSAICTSVAPPESNKDAPTHKFYGQWQPNPKQPEELQFKIDRYEATPTLGDQHVDLNSLLTKNSNVKNKKRA